MRLRFYLRTALIVTALLAMGCFWWVAQPVVVANRFARAIDARDYNRADALCVDPNRHFVKTQLFGPPLSSTAVELYSRVEVSFISRDWHDIWQRQQRMELRIIGQRFGPARVRSFAFTATPEGVRPPQDEVWLNWNSY